MPPSYLDVSAGYTVCELYNLKLSKAEFWLKEVDSQFSRPQKLIFGNQEIRQLGLCNSEWWEILGLVLGKVLWRKYIGGHGAKINRHLCEITVDFPPLGSKNSDILGTPWLFGKIHWYLGATTAVFGETQWYLWEIQWYLRQIQCYGSINSEILGT